MKSDFDIIAPFPDSRDEKPNFYADDISNFSRLCFPINIIVDAFNFRWWYFHAYPNLSRLWYPKIEFEQTLFDGSELKGPETKFFFWNGKLFYLYYICCGQ